MKKMLLLMLTLFMLGAASMNAQVSIGGDKAPETFSVLELINSGAQGLRLPQVTTAQKNTLTSQLSGNVLAKGLTVFNTETGCQETWDGASWISNCGGPIVSAVIQGPITGRASYYMFSYQTITLRAYGAGGSEPSSYQWFRNGAAIPNANSATYTFAPNPASIVGERVDSTFWCVLGNAYANIKSNEIHIIVEKATQGVLKEIPLRKSDGSTITFAAQFLGQESSTDGGYTGDMYQAGRFADGHEKQNSDTTTTQATGWQPPYSPSAVQGRYITTAPWNSQIDVYDNWSEQSGNSPCPSPWRLPTIQDIENVVKTPANTGGSTNVSTDYNTVTEFITFSDGMNKLIWPMASWRNRDANIAHQTTPGWDGYTYARVWGIRADGTTNIIGTNNSATGVVRFVNNNPEMQTRAHLVRCVK
ncbi:hypothetical protein FACS189437_09820 [Bacteroidia bacterium]|nr:hypothetical protein FACS189437_09820 [Bacteroidia bacterium]